MDDQNNQSLVLSRQGLLTVPIEVFTTAAKRPLRCLDLGYNRLETDEVAALGDLEERVLHSRMGSSRGLASQGSMRGQTPISPGGVHLATLRGAAASGGRPYSSMSAADSILGARVPNSRVSTGSVWYHEQSDEAAKLKHLEVLYLSNNALAAIPEELGNLLTLKSLWLDANAITLIPPAISKLEKLQVLSLSHNMIRSVEPTVGCLTVLNQLLLSSNRLGSVDTAATEILPPQLGLLVSLRVLDLADNRIANLPIELGRLHSTLQRLNLHNNPLRFPPAGIVMQGREATLVKFLLPLYEERLDRYKLRARERDVVLRENPDQMGLTREEANVVLSRRATTAASVMSGDGRRLKTPLEIDSGLEIFD
mmetsp:Transcript_666/g.1606  ORF Transcript_666/g.1606 Transcript_666/m.1606 type:complete len:367 (+) Transcript_666:236-1336(+)